MKVFKSLLGFMALLLCLNSPVQAALFSFSTGHPDGKIATASRPSSAGKFEIESADDFVLTGQTSITSASFTGLITGMSPIASIGQVRVEIYRVFPNDSNNPPSGNVPTRVNSPSDTAFDSRDSSAAGGLSFSTTDLGGFTALNSVQPGGIHPIPDVTTGGNGAITGEEVQFSVTFTSPFLLPADHYFFVPQVEVTDPTGNFFWLSAPRPIVPPGTPFPAGFTDLQSWTRDASLDPDWLRVGTDIVGGGPAPTFNATFSISGAPAPSTLLLLSSGLGLLAWRRFR